MQSALLANGGQLAKQLAGDLERWVGTQQKRGFSGVMLSVFKWHSRAVHLILPEVAVLQNEASLRDYIWDRDSVLKENAGGWLS